MKKKIPLTLLSLALALVAFAYFASTQNWINTIVSTKASGTADAAKVVTPEDEKIELIEAHIIKYDDDPETHRQLATALVNRAETTGDAADYDRAWKELDRVESLEPMTARLTVARAALLMSRHRFTHARLVAEEGLKKWADNTELLSIAGDGAREIGDLAGAEVHYRRLVELQPQKVSSWSRLSHLAEARGDLNEAAKLMEKAIDAPFPRPLSPPAAAWARTILGELEAKRGNLAEARRQYMWALHKYPEYPLAVEFMADLDVWEGRPDAAEAGYRQLLKRNIDPKIQINLARLIERRGMKEEAARLRSEALRFYEKVVASGNEGYLRPLAMLELSAGNYKRAAELAGRDMALRPTTESRAIYANILKAANDAGQPLNVAKN